MSEKEEKITKLKDQAKGFLNSGFYYAAADLYARVLEIVPDDLKAHLYVLICENRCQDENGLLKYYRDLYSEKEIEKKTACERDDDLIDQLIKDCFIEDRLTKEEIERKCYYDLSYESCLFCRIDQKQKIIDLFEKDPHISYLVEHGFDFTDKVIEIYDKRIKEAEESDRIESDRIKEEYKEFLNQAKDEVWALYHRIKEEEDYEFHSLIRRYEDTKDTRELEDLIKEFENFNGSYDKEYYIDLCRNKIQNIIDGENLNARQIEKMLDHAESELNNGRFSDAYESYHKIIDMGIERQEAYLGLLKAQNQIADTDNLFDYYKNLYNEERFEILNACEEDKQHIDGMVEKYYLPDYLEKEEIKAAYYFDLSYRSSLNHRIQEKDRFNQYVDKNPYLKWLKNNSSYSIRKKIDEVFDTYEERIRDSERKDEEEKRRISNDYHRFLFNTYSLIRKKYQTADENKDKEYRKLINRIDDADSENRLSDLIIDLKSFGDYKDIDRYISICQRKIDEIREKEEKKATQRKNRQAFEEGIDSLKRGRLEKAERSFSVTLKDDPDEPYANLGLLMIEIGVKNLEELADHYKKLYSDYGVVNKEACDVDQGHIDQAYQRFVIPGYLEKETVDSYYRIDRNYEAETDQRLEQREMIEDEFRMNPYLSKAMKNKDERIDAFFDEILDEYDRRIRLAEKNDEAKKNTIRDIYQHFLKQGDQDLEELYQKKRKEKEADDDGKYQDNIRRISDDLSDQDLEDLIADFDPDYKDSDQYISKIKEMIEERKRIETADSFSELLKKANKLLDQKDYDSAKDAFRSYLKYDDQNEEVYLKLLLAENQKEDIDVLFDDLKELYSDHKPIKKKALEIDQNHIDEICEKYAIPGKLEKEEIEKHYIFDVDYDSLYDCRLLQKEKIIEKIKQDTCLSWLFEHGSDAIKEKFNDLLSVYDLRIRKSEENDEEKAEEIRKNYESFIEETDRSIEKKYLELTEIKKKETPLEVKKEKKKTEILKDQKKRKERDPRMAAFIAIAAVVLVAVCGVLYYLNNVKQIDDYEKAMELAQEGKYDEAIAIFDELGDYKESVYYRKQMIYMKADDFYQKGRYQEALELFSELRFDDSEERAAQIKKKLASSADVGDYIFFGSYEQDGDDFDGKEMIEWIVIDRQSDQLLLISRYALEMDHFDDSSVYWEDSSIRLWLNGEFINNAFTKEEKETILQTTLFNSKFENEEENSSIELSKTRDLIFLLSEDDINLYFPEERNRICEVTDYAKKSGIKTAMNGTCDWWLRSCNMEKDNTVQVVSGIDGSIQDYSGQLSSGVRPALWIKSN